MVDLLAALAGWDRSGVFQGLGPSQCAVVLRDQRTVGSEWPQLWLLFEEFCVAGLDQSNPFVLGRCFGCDKAYLACLVYTSPTFCIRMSVYSNFGMFCFESSSDQRRRVIVYFDRRYLKDSLVFLLPHGVDSAPCPLTTRTGFFLMSEQVSLNELFLHLEAAVMRRADVVSKRQLTAFFVTAGKQF